MTDPTHLGQRPHDDALIHRLESTYGVGLAVLLFAMMAVTFIDVIGRFFLNAPLRGAYEINVLLLGAVVYLALPLTTLREEHVTISLLQTLFRGRAKQVQIVLVNLFSVLVIGAVGWRLWVQADKLADSGNRMLLLDMPLAPIVYLMSVLAGATAGVHLLLAARYAFGRTKQNPDVLPDA